MQNTKPTISANDVDRLGSLLAQISDLQKQADLIKDNLKKSGLIELDGSLFHAAIVSSLRTTYDPRKVELLLGDRIGLVERTSESVSVRVTARKAA